MDREKLDSSGKSFLEKVDTIIKHAVDTGWGSDQMKIEYAKIADVGPVRIGVVASNRKGKIIKYTTGLTDVMFSHDFAKTLGPEYLSVLSYIATMPDDYKRVTYLHKVVKRK